MPEPKQTSTRSTQGRRSRPKVTDKPESGNGDATKIVRKQKKSTRLVEGLLITDCLTFHKWMPGDKLTEHILLKNTGKDAVIISYTSTEALSSELCLYLNFSPTTTPSFTTPFPKKLELFTGNVFRVPVTFEPTKKQHYEDVMKFQVKETIVPVRLFADIPQLLVELSTKALEFGERPCGVKMSKTLTLSNRGERDFGYNWFVECPFLIEPSEGRASVGSTLTITMTFNPNEVAQYRRNAVLTCTDGEFTSQLLVELHARSRCAMYLKYQPVPKTDGHVNLEFGEFALGETSLLQFSVCSNLAVDVPFSLTRHNPYGETAAILNESGDATQEKECFFANTISSGTMVPNVWCELPITFQAKSITTGRAEYFIFKSGLRDAAVIVRCYASVQGPTVTSSIDMIDFGVGVITVDVFGTCHSSLVQPPILTRKQIDNFDQKQFSEFMRSGPRAVKDKMESGVLRLEDDGIHYNTQDNIKDLQATEAELSASPVLKFSDWFQPPIDRHKNPFTLDKMEIFFGYAAVGAIAIKAGKRRLNYFFFDIGAGEKLFLYQLVKLANLSDEPIVVNWTNDSDRVFVVTPQTATIGAMGSVDFTVSFSPNITDLFFLTELECHVMFEFLSGFQLIKDYQVIPPWSSKIRLCGHTASLKDKTYLRPRLTLEGQDDSSVVFREFALGGESFATFSLTNPTENTLMFRMAQDSESGLKVLRKFFVLKSRESSLIAVQVGKSEPKTQIDEKLNLIFNDFEKHTQSVKFRGLYDPEIRVSVQNHLPFPNTAVSKQSKLTAPIINTSLFPVKFQWFIPEALKVFVDVSTLGGIIAANDQKVVSVTFSPKDRQSYQAELLLRIVAPQGSFQTHRVIVHGNGVIGHLSYSFKRECIGTPATYTFKVHNNNAFDVECQLLAHCTAPDGTGSMVDLKPHSPRDVDGRPLKVSTNVFRLQALTHEKVNMIFIAHWTGSTVFTLYSQALCELPEASDRSALIKEICTITVEAKQPVMQIVDLIGLGSLSVFGKQRLWELLRVQNASPVPEINCWAEICVELGTAVIGETSTQVLRQHNIIEIVPRRGIVREHATATVDFKCSHNFLGDHVLPIILEIAKGKLVFLRLSAKTISQADVALVVSKGYVTFPDMPVSGQYPMTQMISIYNPSNHEVTFAVSIKEQSLSELEITPKVFSCTTPTGSIPARTFGVIPFTYQPQHLRRSKAIATVTIQNEQIISLFLEGSGCTTEQFCKAALMPRQHLQPQQDYLLPESRMLYISTTHVDFGCVPLFSVNRKIFFAENRHTEGVRFRWRESCTSQTDTDKLLIEPRFGQLKPGGSTLFTVAYHARNVCSQFIHTFTLQFVDDAKMSKYTKWLKDWLVEVRERCLNFTITDTNLTADKDVAKSLAYIATLQASLSHSTTNLGPAFPHLSPGFVELMCMLKARPDVKVPPLMAEPKMHEVHFTAAGQCLESSLFRQAYPEKLRNFHHPATEQIIIPSPSTLLSLDDASPEITTVTNVLMEKTIKTVLQEDFNADVSETMRNPPDVFYADFIRERKNIAEMIEEPFWEDGNAGVSKLESMSRIEGEMENNFSGEGDGDLPQIYAISPRVIVQKRAPTTEQPNDQQESMRVPENSHGGSDSSVVTDQMIANIVLDTTFAAVSREIFHEFFTSVLQDCRASTFDLFDQPKLLLHREDAVLVDSAAYHESDTPADRLK
ncbi:putative Coiled-coil [Hypsibius exemplaris]|uniref:Coiled-coil n=1 Tax=Hypsibius exemplaris TaxID=2072580 RepID=A0A1W0X016_HYPEX|nr:putative Coiled-coil [Hypsibius exemplaris]